MYILFVNGSVHLCVFLCTQLDVFRVFKSLIFIKTTASRDGLFSTRAVYRTIFYMFICMYLNNILSEKGR